MEQEHQIVGVVLEVHINENLEILQLHPSVTARQDFLMIALINNNVQLVTIAA